jgi:hypothetical protein
MADRQRPPIPEVVKREVRRRCGFGCVICGIPIYEYDHIPGYAIVQRHESSEITLLCDKHHTEKTRRLLDIDTVVAANSNPYNLRRGVSTSNLMHYTGDQCYVAVGSVLLTRTYQGPGTTCAAIMIDSVPMIAFTLEAGHLLLTLNAFDRDGRHILQIDRNHLAYSMHPWDITFSGDRLTIRSGHRDILLRLRFKVPHTIVVERGQFMLHGIDVMATKDYLAVVNKRLIISRGIVREAQIGLTVGKRHGAGIFVPIAPNERYSLGSYLAGDRKLVDSQFRTDAGKKRKNDKR